jgi:hypothetical protein
MAAPWRITEVQLLDEYTVRVRFTDGIEGVVHFSPEFFKGEFSHLIDPAKFGEVAVVGGAVTWPGGLDLAPDAMYDEIKLRGEWVPRSNADDIVERKPGAWSDLPISGDEDWIAPISLLDDPDMQKAPQALLRAAKKALQLAAQTGTPFVVRHSATPVHKEMDMQRQIKESDWKLLGQLRTIALERFCQRILSEIERINISDTKSYHQRYLEIYQVIESRDKEIAQTFNDHRRSTALNELALIQSHGLLTTDEYLRFSQETRDVVSYIPMKQETSGQASQ